LIASQRPTKRAKKERHCCLVLRIIKVQKGIGNELKSTKLSRILIQKSFVLCLDLLKNLLFI
jgi:hypothetical protein